MSTPTTQAASTPAASAGANTVVASSATTGGSLASTPVVTSTVTTPSSPKRTMSLVGYKNARSNMVPARDELEALFDVGSDADIEDEEEEDIGTSSSTRVDPSVGSRRPREDDSDASSSKRSRSGAASAAGNIVVASSHWSSARPMVADSKRDPYSLRQSSTLIQRWIKGAITSSDPFMSSDGTGIRRLPRRSRVPEWQALCQSWGAFVENFKKNPAGYREHVCLARERYELFSKRPKIDRLHPSAVEAGIPCAVPMGIACEHCHAGAVRVSERDINGYTGVLGPEEPKTPRTNLIAQMSSSAAGGRSTLPRAVGDYSSRSSFAPFGGFGGDGLRTPKSFPTNTKMIWTMGPDLTTNNSLDGPASCSLCVSQWGWRQREDAARLVHQTPLIVWRLLNGSRSLRLLL
ncbi:unnamed protein product [Phytophthora fragariaefolia]|uniref:Unnamed protein product n=1 Tax=Phytophthora fragariaefolia TaxID=1490495 RepID=A0A9W6WTE4_9STRA|nr:unnamed protein product [Phytophthora fragariaefolia]